MSKVKDNIITEGLSGRLGKSRLIFRTGKNGKTSVALRSPASEDRVFNEAQQAQQEAFAQATQYAVLAKDNPIYVNLAQETDASAYNLAVADWFRKPKVLDLNTDGWTGGIGHTIRVKATDDTKVTRVQVTIHQDGNVLEAGEAVPSSADGLLWTYVTTTNLTGTPNLQLDANAFDLPGNTGQMSITVS